MKQYKNMKVKVRSPNGDTDYFDIEAGVLQGDTLAPYFFIICLDYVLRTSIDKMKDNSFKLTKEKKKRYPAHAITDISSLNGSSLKLVDKFTFLGSSVSSTRDSQRHGQLFIGYQSYGSHT